MASLPPMLPAEAEILSKMELIAHTGQGLEADLSYQSPKTLAALLTLRAADPKAQIVAGCTDVGLWILSLIHI